MHKMLISPSSTWSSKPNPRKLVLSDCVPTWIERNRIWEPRLPALQGQCHEESSPTTWREKVFTASLRHPPDMVSQFPEQPTSDDSKSTITCFLHNQLRTALASRAYIARIVILAPYALLCSCLSSASVPPLIPPEIFIYERVEVVAKEAGAVKEAEVVLEVVKVGLYLRSWSKVAHQIW